MTTLGLARNDLAAFSALVWPGFELAPHVELLVGALEAVERGECKRLMVSMPPRHGKSLLCSQLFPAWCLGRDPKRLIVGASHGQELADLFGRRVRNLMFDDRFRATFPGCRLSEDSQAAGRFDTTERGSYFAVGRGGGLTGRGADLIVIDDPLRGPEEAGSPTVRSGLKEWYSAVAYTRLQPGGAIIIVSTRWHLDDLSGWLLREHADERWRVISLPALAEANDPLGRMEGEALWPSKYPVEALEQIRRQQVSESWLALFQGRPVPEGGAVFRAEWFKTYSELPPFISIVQGWDTSYGKDAARGDWSSCCTIGQAKDGYYVIDLTRGRWPFPELKRKVTLLAERFKPTAIIVEDAVAGTSVLQEFQGESSLPLIAVKPTSAKVLRAQLVSPLCEAGKVFLPEVAPWKGPFVEELLSFPASAHDDMTDSFIYALGRARNSGFDLESWAQLEAPSHGLRQLTAGERKESEDEEAELRREDEEVEAELRAEGWLDGSGGE